MSLCQFNSNMRKKKTVWIKKKKKPVEAQVRAKIPVKLKRDEGEDEGTLAVLLLFQVYSNKRENGSQNTEQIHILTTNQGRWMLKLIDELIARI